LTLMTAPAGKKLLFVYGTLKRRYSNSHYMTGQEYLGEAQTVPGFELYDLGTHPGMVGQAGGQLAVVGEVWAVDAPALARLDELEGLAEGFYRRERVPLQPPFAERAVEAYFYARSVQGRRALGGVWRE
jgi:gamma-glutamylaminecyclotransferase